MKKILISVALLISACTKESNSKLNSSDVNNAHMVLATITCACDKNPYYEVWYSLSQTKPGIGTFIIFSSDSVHVSSFVKVSSVDGSNNMFIWHTGYANGVGALYIIKGTKPTKGEALTFVLAELKDLHNLDCSACPNTPISPKHPFDTIPIP
jgi:hypothetical protein